jgi:hypothetical protein
MRPHLLQDERSFEIHRLVAERLESDGALLSQARERVSKWLSTGSTHRRYAKEWQDLLNGPIEALLAVLRDPGDRSTALRHVSPFAGAIDEATRRRVWREVRERLNARIGHRQRRD